LAQALLARDITEQREKERRFTQLFETLQEGCYFSTPEGKLLDANPALVQMLGYHSREELLGLPPAALNVEADQEPVLGRAGSQTGSTRTRENPGKKKGRERGSLRGHIHWRDRGGTNRALPGHPGRRSPKSERWSGSCGVRKNFGGTCWRVSPT